MSQVAFEKLFSGYPACDEVVRLRHAVQIAIVDDLITLPPIRKALPEATLYSDDAFVAAIRAIEGLRVWHVRGLPQRVENDLLVLREPYEEASCTYHSAGAELRGRFLFRRRNRQTSEEFAAYRDAVHGVLGDMIAWLKEVQPDA